MTGLPTAVMGLTMIVTLRTEGLLRGLPTDAGVGQNALEIGDPAR